MFIVLAVMPAMLPLAAAYEQTANEDFPEPDVPVDIIPVLSPGPVGIVDELRKAHSTVTDIMIHTQQAIANEGYADEEIYFEAVWVDEKTDELVIILDPAQAFFDPIDAQDMQEELGTTAPIRIAYGIFTPEASLSEATSCPADEGSSICYYWDRYITRCLPETTTSRCNTYAAIITGAGYPLPTITGSTAPVDTDGDGINDDVDQCDDQPETVNGYQDQDGCPDTPPTTGSDTVFSDDFEDGFSKWTRTGQLEWEIGALDERVYIDGDATNNVAKADDCDDEACIITSQSFDLTGYSDATLEFHRFVDRSLDSGEYLEVRIGSGGTYSRIFYWTDGDGNDDLWHRETYNLDSYLTSSDVTIRFLTEESSAAEDVGIDNVLVTGTADDAACVLDVTATLRDDGDIQISWNDCGDDIRRYKVYYAGDDGIRRLITSVYGSTGHLWSGASDGSTYTFSVKAQYDDYTYTDYFESGAVEVPESDTIPPRIAVPESLELAAQSSNGTVVTFNATGHDLADGQVQVACVPPSGSLFAAGTNTTVTCTAADAAGNTATASFNVAIAGAQSDSDSDGEVPPTAVRHELRGGMPIRMFSNNPFWDPAFGGAATAGLVMEYDNKTALLISSHAINGLHAYRTTSLDINPASVILPEIGSTVLADSNVGLDSVTKSDAALIEVTGQDIESRMNEIQSGDQVIRIIGFGGVNSLPDNATIEVSARHNQGTGHIWYTNVTASITILDGVYTVTEHAAGNYTSQRGDSGGPIYKNHGNGTATMLGIVTAGSCIIDTDGRRLVELDDYGNCIEVFKIFSTWENIADELNMR